MVVTFCCT